MTDGIYLLGRLLTQQICTEILKERLAGFCGLRKGGCVDKVKVDCNRRNEGQDPGFTRESGRKVIRERLGRAERTTKGSKSAWILVFDAEHVEIGVAATTYRAAPCVNFSLVLVVASFCWRIFTSVQDGANILQKAKTIRRGTLCILLIASEPEVRIIYLVSSTAHRHYTRVSEQPF